MSSSEKGFVMNKKAAYGFTLIELMIVIVILAILAVLAYPSFLQYIRQTRLEDARADLIANAQMLERYYTQCRNFNSSSADKNPCNATPALSQQHSEGHFNVRFDGTPSPNGYVLVAAPVSGSSETRYLKYDSTTSNMLLCDSEELAKCKSY